MSRRRRALRPALAVAAAALLLAVAAEAPAAWSVAGAGSGAAIARVDFHPPAVTAAVVAAPGAATGGAVRPGGQLVVLANASDALSGVADVVADVSAIAAGSTAVPLARCVSACSVGGVTYGYASAPLAADAGLADGSLTFSVSATDNAGNASSPAAFGVIVDADAPAITAATVATTSTGGAGWVAQGGSYVVYASAADAGSPASGIASVTADVSSLTAAQTALPLPRCTSACTVGGVTYGYKSAVTTAASPLAEGSTSFAVEATDAARNASQGTFAVAVDDTAPSVPAAAVVTSASSTAGWIKQGGTYVVYANAADNGAVSSVKADVSALTSGQSALALSACTSSCTVGGVTYGWKSASKTAGGTLAEGTLGFTITVTDKAGNAASAASTVAVDDTAPSLSALVVANSSTSTPGWVKPGGSYYVYANASDAGSGVWTVKANVSSLTNGQTALALSACASGCTVGGVTYAWKSASKVAGSALGEGTLAFTITATDRANNAGTAAGSVSVDASAPSVPAAAVATTATGVAGWLGQGKAYAVYANVSDAASGVGTVTANVGSLTTGQTAAPLSPCSVGCTVGGVSYGYKSAALTANATLSAGVKTFTVTASDLAGNAVTQSGFSATVDNTAPGVTLTFPLATYAGGWSAGCGTAGVDDVCGTASDAASGVASVQVSMRQAAAPALYWDPGAGAFSSATELFLSATPASPTWYAAFEGSALAGGRSYTVRALATDAAGNTASSSVSFTFSP